MKNKYFHYLVSLILCGLLSMGSASAQIYLSADTPSCGSGCTLITGTLVGETPTSAGITTDDGWSGVISIGFTYNFYGTAYTQLLIGSNGSLGFNTSLAGSGFGWSITRALLGNATVRNCICGPWCDIYIPAGGTITYSTVGTAPYRKFVATWCHTRMYSCTSQWTTTQIVIYETTDIAEVHIAHKTICSWNGGYAIVGVQNAAGSVATAAPSRDYPTVWSTTNEGWRFTPDTTSSGAATYTVASITYSPVPYASSTISWFDSTSGAYLGSGDTITICPTVPTVISAMAAGCDDTTITSITVYPAPSGTPVSINPLDTARRAGMIFHPRVCGSSDGMVRLTGINPFIVDTLFFSYNGVPQPIRIDSAGSDSVLTVSGLCAGVYDYFYVKQGDCVSNSVAATLINPPFRIADTSSTNASCSACDGTFTLYGLPPGLSISIQYDYEGVTQTPIRLTSSGAGTVVVRNLCPGRYNNIVASLTSCSPGACVATFTGTIVISWPPLIPIAIRASVQPSECGACNGTIKISGVAPGSVDTIFFSKDGVAQTPVVTVAAADSTVTLFNLCEGDYTNFFIKEGPCPTTTITSTVPLVDPPIVPLFTTSVKYGCTWDTVYFTNRSTSPGMLWYRWDFGDGTIDTNANPVHYFRQGTYIVKLFASNRRCVDSMMATVSLVHPIVADFRMRDSIICQGVANATINTSTGTPPTYVWSFGDGSTSTQDNPVHAYANVGNYTVRLIATNFVPCSDTTYRTVTVDSQTVMSLHVSDTNICRGATITLSSDFTDIGFIGLVWKLGNGDSVFEHNPVMYSYTSTGTYTIEATARYRVCAPVTTSQVVRVFAVPAITLGEDTAICAGSAPISLIDATNAGNPLASWLWSTGETSPAIEVAAPGLYFATVTINGCNAADSVLIADGCEVHMAKAFTPNGDGVNDYFVPRDLLNMLASFKLTVFNRYGSVVFQSSNLEGRGWDGKFNDVPQPTGVYIYTIEATFKDGTKRTLQGNVTLLR
jgi:gliding motility-associated-like protein